jgi:hypothetical protein
MPWCDDCSKFWNQDSMGADGECPNCGKVVVAPRKGIPWHFKLMLIAFAVYMVYRIYWLIEWLPKHI